MPLKFLSFPNLIQEYILKNMELCEVFMMSLVSKKTKYCSIRARIKIPKILFNIRKKAQSIRIGIDEKKMKTKTIIRLWEVRKLKTRRAVRIKIGDDFEDLAKIRSQESQTNEQLCLIKVECIDETLMKGLYDHFKSLFCESKSNSLWMETSMLFSIEKLPIYENVDKIFLTGESESADAKDFESFITRYPNLDSLRIQPEIIGELDVVIDAQKVRLTNAGKFGTSLLEKFDGRHLLFSKWIVEEKQLNEFIKKWMKGEGYHNLETIQATLILNWNIRMDDVVNELETERFDRTKRPEHFNIDNETLFGFYSPPVSFAGNDTYDVIRESDGKRASVRASTNSFWFAVWNAGF
ncbi:hypothetical protein CRE_09578 [Caenorhabditis remanei]|uniref:F-box domain-containing protein n=1 Tax=Caenorhabditis remanei TaxID=31234 RepID=E3MIY7_CAERE|nr:hypothetical protein CRE_09578 [Caenorhabditis remanei]